MLQHMQHVWGSVMK